MRETLDEAEDRAAGRDPDADVHDVRLSTKRVSERYGVSTKSIERWERDPRLDFPEPIRIYERKYWRLADLVRWERQRASRRAPKAPAQSAEAAA